MLRRRIDGSSDQTWPETSSFGSSALIVAGSSARSSTLPSAGGVSSGSDADADTADTGSGEATGSTTGMPGDVITLTGAATDGALLPACVGVGMAAGAVKTGAGGREK